VESIQGFDFIPELAKLEENLGFRSSFNLVLEKYPIDERLVQSLQERGFEIVVHGLKHDGKLFTSKKHFLKRAERINQYIGKHHTRGFRAPLMHRNPEWMQALDVDYDLSFFDTDPYEPQPGGTMSIWPFFIGRFVELPYTLVQDCTLASVLGETTPRLWLEKLDFIEQYHGMALMNTHPDFLREERVLGIYIDFLRNMKEKKGCWHALPYQVAGWWRDRASISTVALAVPSQFSTITLDQNRIIIQ
jgi:hypothetical protein